MEAESLKELCLESCDQLMEYFENHKNDRNPPGDFSNEIIDYNFMPNGHVILYTTQKVSDTTDMKLRLNNNTFDSDRVGFDLRFLQLE